MNTAHYFRVLSPSNVNSFIDYRSMWFLTRIAKQRLPKSADMFRGSAVEKAIAMCLTGSTDSLAKAIKEAQDWYQEALLSENVEDEEDYLDSIEKLAAYGLKILVENYGELTGVQVKHVTRLDGHPMEWMGYTDFEFDGNVVVDLKITKRTPSKLTAAHARQGAFYHHCVNGCKQVDFIYLIPLKKETKCQVFTVDRIEYHLKTLVDAAHAMDEMLSKTNNPQILAKTFYPSPDDWWMQDEGNFEVADKVWGLTGEREIILPKTIEELERAA